ncbi:secretion protein [Flavobacterium aquiphilum]|uniref:secretion protein n=1 Tax=Flavobacterium aquiphilum TaxID=3003261 RepID=UPI00247FB153|nr:secretion protein [Flavobacterium aquiphilum]
MKTILKISLIVLVAMTTMGAHAIGGDFLLNVKKATGKEICFSVNGIQKANVAIYDKEHTLIYSEKVTGTDGIMKTYSLEEFPEGTYFLEVETSQKKVTHEIVVAKEASTLSRKSIAEVYKGDLKMENKNVVTVN